VVGVLVGAARGSHRWGREWSKSQGKGIWCRGGKKGKEKKERRVGREGDKDFIYFFIYFLCVLRKWGEKQEQEKGIRMETRMMKWLEGEVEGKKWGGRSRADS
jgi:hypothetical protein